MKYNCKKGVQMIVFDIIWNIIGILFALLGLVACLVIVFLLLAFVAGLGERGIKQKEKPNDNTEN